MVKLGGNGKQVKYAKHENVTKSGEFPKVGENNKFPEIGGK